MLLMRLNDSLFCVMYERFAIGRFSRGKGTVFHCAPARAVMSSLPHEPNQKRLRMLASVRLKLYSPPSTPLKPEVCERLNIGASSDTGTRRCLVLTNVSPGA